MYQLYFLANACSLATQVVLRELNQPFDLIPRPQDFTQINATNQVPVLGHQGQYYKEGAAILLFLAQRHPSSLFPIGQQHIENLLFANATLHPAYGRLFFAAANMPPGAAQTAFLAKAAQAIEALWQVLEDRLADQPYLGGQAPSAADILIAVYARWGDNFEVTIALPPKVKAMVTRVQQRPSFVQSIEAEQQVG